MFGREESMRLICREAYWSPDATGSGSVNLFGRSVTVIGQLLRLYLWLQGQYREFSRFQGPRVRRTSDRS